MVTWGPAVFKSSHVCKVLNDCRLGEKKNVNVPGVPCSEKPEGLVGHKRIGYVGIIWR